MVADLASDGLRIGALVWAKGEGPMPLRLAMWRITLWRAGEAREHRRAWPLSAHPGRRHWFEKAAGAEYIFTAVGRRDGAAAAK